MYDDMHGYDIDVHGVVHDAVKAMYVDFEIFRMGRVRGNQDRMKAQILSHKGRSAKLMQDTIRMQCNKMLASTSAAQRKDHTLRIK